MSDRFDQPERPAPTDPRRVFIPAPPGSPSRPASPGAGRGDHAGRAARSAVDTRARQAPARRPAGPPGEAPARPGPSRPWWRRLRWRRVLAIVAVLVLLGLLGGYLWARSVWNRVDRVEVSDVLSDGNHGTNYLIVGSDSREDLGKGDPGFNGTKQPAGQRSDTMMILHLEGGKAKMLSLPRDLYVQIADTGNQQKLNAAYNGGPKRLIKTVTQSLGIPVNHYMEVDFVSFAGLVDGLGGVTIDFPHPAHDVKSGLYINESGPVKLNGDEALAYVRSRTYTEVIDGQNRVDPTADLGRIQRQQAFLRAVFSKLSHTKNPFALGSAFSGLAGGLRVDNDMSMFDALRLGWALRGVDTKQLKLETHPERNASGAVLILDEDASKPALDQVR